MAHGRVQPIDSVARDVLLQIRGTTSVPLEDGKAVAFWQRPPKISATRWALEVMTRPDDADGRRIFLIQHPELLGELGSATLKGPGSGTYSFRELAELQDEIEKRAQKITALEAEKRSAAEQQLLKLYDALLVYQRLKNSLQPNSILQVRSRGAPVSYDFAARLDRFSSGMGAGYAARAFMKQGKRFDGDAVQAVGEFLGPYEKVSRFALPLLVPPDGTGASPDAWQSIGNGLLEGFRSGRVKPAVAFWARIASAFSRGNVTEFDLAVDEYRKWLTAKGLTAGLKKADAEFPTGQVAVSAKGGHSLPGGPR
jgi:hypothetical protein